MVRILIADDHQMVRLALAQILEQADQNWRVCFEAMDGNEAVQRSLEMRPDLVMLDFAMPDLDGISAGQRIRRRLPDTPVLVYTFMVTPQLEAFVKASGLQGVVAKADTQALIAEVRRVLSLAPCSAPN